MNTPGRWFVMLVLLAFGSGARAAEWVYTVQPGDNPWNLTERLLAGIKYWPRLQSHNHIADSNHIPPGTRLRIPVGWLRRTEATATVAAVQGAAELLRTSGTSPRSLKSGALLRTGDVVRTGERGNVTVEFKDGSRMLVHAGSELRMADLAVFANTDLVDTRVELVRGRAENLVQPLNGAPSRFEIRTPAAVTSVRGTGFRVNAAEDATRTEVLEGRVGVRTGSGSARGETAVAAGFGTVAAISGSLEAPVPLLAAPVLDGLPAVVGRVPIAFNVPTQSGAVAYRLQIAATPLFDTLLYDGHSTATLLRAIDLPDGDYHVRVRGIDARGLEGLNADRAFTLNARPEPPLLSQPAPGAGVMDEQPTFEWAAVSGVGRYRLQLAQDKDFTALLADADQLTTNSFVVPAALALGDYHWRVMSIDSTEGAGPFSDAQTFRRVPPAPQAASEVNDKELTLSWPAGLPGERYQLQISADEGFESPLSTVDSAEPSVRLPRPPGGTYYIRVRSIYPDGFEAPYGKPQMIELPSTHKPWWLLLVPLLFVL